MEEILTTGSDTPTTGSDTPRQPLPVFTDRGLSWLGCPKTSTQLNVYDYMADIPANTDATDLVEVQFKNTRKGFYHNSNHLPLEKGDVVAVEASPGHDIGTVTLTGNLVLLQMKRTPPRNPDDIKRIYRKVRPVDMEKYEEAKAREHETMIRSRQIAKELGLEMKIGDVEFQGDGQKAIFYYIADGRVDFRQLIKVLAEAFHVRIEMKQIGARQEAGRIGGFGPCGRELCCTTWMRSFVSVSTAAARFQDLSLNPQKLAGQCAKLKCCMNYEADQYVEASRRLPSREVTLHTQEGEYFLFKSDILAGMVTYSTDKRIAANLTTITAKRALEVIAMNRDGINPEALDDTVVAEPAGPIDLATQEDLTRFDKAKKKKKKKKKADTPADTSQAATTTAATAPTAQATQTAQAAKASQTTQTAQAAKATQTTQTTQTAPVTQTAQTSPRKPRQRPVAQPQGAATSQHDTKASAQPAPQASAQAAPAAPRQPKSRQQPTFAHDGAGSVATLQAVAAAVSQRNAATATPTAAHKTPAATPQSQPRQPASKAPTEQPADMTSHSPNTKPDSES